MVSREEFTRLVHNWNVYRSKEHFLDLYRHEFGDNVKPPVRVFKIILHTLSGRYREIEEKGLGAWR